jgi:hypothetical protein
MENSSMHQTALDQLALEDTELLKIFGALDRHRKTSVQDRAEYGILVKQLIRHVTTREAALVDIVAAIESTPSLGPVVARMQGGTEPRRTLIDRIEHMSRGVQGINLNTGQDLDSELLALEELLQSEVSWELSEAVPAIRAALRSEENVGEIHSARHIVRHAPTNLDPQGPRWYERAPFISRALTIYDHLRDFPKAAHGGRERARDASG